MWQFWLKFKPDFQALWLKHTDFWAGILSLGIAWWLMSLTFASSSGELMIASKAWSDFGAHLPLIRSFTLGANWPPEYPLFPGEPIRYHFLFYALVGWGEKLGLNLGLVFNGLSALGFGLMIWMMYRVARLIFKSRLAGFLALWFGLMNSSLSAWVLAEKQGLSWWHWLDWPQLWQIVSQAQHFVCFGPWDGQKISAFWTLNVFTNQRHLGLSLGLVWWVIWPLLQWWWPNSATNQFQSQPKLKTSASKTSPLSFLSWGLRVLVLAGFPLLHQAGAVLVSGLIVGLISLGWLQSKLRPGLSRQLLAIYSLGLALLGLVMIQFVPASQTLPAWSPGFLATNQTFLGLLDFWWWNLGLGLLIWLIGLFWPTPGRRILWLVTPIFIAANLWRFSPDMINNHKFVNLFSQVVAMVAAGWLAIWWQRVYQFGRLAAAQPVPRRWLGLPLSAAGLALGSLVWWGWSLSGLVDFFPILNDQRYVMTDWSNQSASVWLEANTPPKTVVLSTTYLYHPASLVGRKLFLDYGYFAWSLGYQDSERRALLPRLFGQFPNLKSWCQALQRQNIGAVVISPGDGELGKSVPITTGFMAKYLEPTVVTADDYQIYQISQYCPNF